MRQGCSSGRTSRKTGARDGQPGATQAGSGFPLVDDCASGPLTVVTENGPACKSADFVDFIARNPSSAKSGPDTTRETNGVVERFNQSLKYEHLQATRSRRSSVWPSTPTPIASSTTGPHDALTFVAPMVR